MVLEMAIQFVLDFLVLLIPLTIICFALYKVLSKAREHLVEQYELSWTRSCLALNFIMFFAIFFITYLYFFFIGASLAVQLDPEVEYTILDNLSVLFFASIRMVVASIILAIGLYFFELVGSFVIDSQKKSKRSKIVKELIGICVSCALFLLLFLLVFNWAALGLFVYVFYGGVKALPLII